MDSPNDKNPGDEPGKPPSDRDADPTETGEADADEIGTGNVIRLAIAFELGVLVVAWALGELVERPALAAARWDWADFGWGVLAAAPLLLAIIGAMKLPIPAVRRLREFCDEFLVAMFRGSRWSELLLVAALAGIGEEMLFRGVVQHGLASAIGAPYGIWIGLAIGGLTFGLAHYVSGTYAILAGAVGLYLGVLSIWTDNLLTPIVAHAVYDFGAFVYLLSTASVFGPPWRAGRPMV